MTNIRTNNHIEEYFADRKESSEERAGKQIFTAKDDDVILKTELDAREIRLINTMMINDTFLISRGLIPAYENFHKNFLKLQISKDRQSRHEFVNIHKKDATDDVVKGMTTAGTLFGGVKQ